MGEPRFLVVRLSSLGDIVHTFPAVAALRESFPNAEIDWLTHPRWQFLVESSGLANEVWATETRSLASLRETVQKIRAKRFDVAVDYQGLWKSAGLTLFGGVRKRVGFSRDTIREFGVPVLYTDRVRVTTQHIAEQNGELSQRAGANSRTEKFSLRVPDSDEEIVKQKFLQEGIGRYVVLSPGGGWRSKCWPAERFGELCVRIRTELGVRCVINYGPGEESIVRAIQSASGGASPVPCNGSLAQLMAMLRGALCVVGGDTGPLHLAVALGTPVVALFGPTDPARNGPFPNHSAHVGRDIILRSTHAETSYKRGDEPHPSILKLDLDTVFAALLRCTGLGHGS